MFRFIKHKKVFKIISFLLIMAFSVNLVGCDNKNNVSSGQSGGGNNNYSVGVGSNVTGYKVYSQSTFDPMTLNLFKGYLLASRSFTLVVLPGEEVGDDGTPLDSINQENVLFSNVQYGIYEYNVKTGNYDDPEEKALMYYTTNKELVRWFNAFEADDKFMSNALEFASSTTNLNKLSRYKCEILVNLGNGLNSDDFCGEYNSSSGTLYGGIITNELPVKYKDGTTKKVFDDPVTGGMILFFGMGTIEGYMTYEHINQYEGSSIANSFDDCSYSTYGIQQFNYDELINAVRHNLKAEGYSDSAIADYANNDELKQDIISFYTEQAMLGKKGCERLKETYKLLHQSLLTDYNVNSLSSVKSAVDSKDVDEDTKKSVYEMVDMINDFDNQKESEQFSIKISAAIFSRYNDIRSISSLDSLNSGKKISRIEEIASYDILLNNYVRKQNATEDDDYLVIVTADGFIHSRGGEGEQIANGSSDMLGFSAILQELIRMDACPNGTIAAEMFNMLANLKIYAGTALAIAGVTAMVVAKVGLTAASVIAKLATVSSVTPVPGGRIAALVLLGIAGLIALGAGIYAIYSGLKDKARVKGMGASEEDYCKTYKATINSLFETMTLSIPIYHYEISRANANDGNDSINLTYCEVGAYDSEKNLCVVYDEQNPQQIVNSSVPVHIPLYYYANRDQATELGLQGMPIIMYYSDGILVDSIYGATTPDFIIEALRFWGVLAMREIVYTLTVSESAVDVYHTNNNNARTVHISEARYCYTSDYAKDLYSTSTSNSLCFFDGNQPKTTEINKSWNYGDDSSESILTINTSDKTEIEKRLEGLYASDALYGYFSNLSVYEFHTIRNNHFSSVYEELTPTTVTDFVVNLSSLDYEMGSTQTVTYKEGETEKSLTGYYYSNGNNTFIISGNDVHYFKKIEGTDNYYGVIATVKEDFNSTVKSDLNKIGSEPIDFLLFIVGEYSFGVEPTVEVPLYMTVTIKESPQANYYYTSDGYKTTCDEDEYVYTRESWFGSTSKVCLADDKVKIDKDSVVSLRDINPNSEESYRYYTTSILVATLTVGIKQNGQNNFSIQWIGKGGN